jgi:hypothetical protein
MTRSLFPIVLIGTVFCYVAGQATAQQLPTPPATPQKHKGLFKPRPWKDAKAHRQLSLAQAQAGTTIPLWQYNITSPTDGQNYTGTMVGRSPFNHGHRTTTIQTYIIPVKLTFADTGTVFDPSAPDSCIGNSTVVDLLTKSPLFQNAPYNMNGADVGTTQYVDAFQRASFWQNVAATPYHAILSYKVLPPISVTVPDTEGSTNWSFCGYYGTMEINWWDAYVQNTLLPALAAQGVGPTNFPIFLFDSVFEYDTYSFNCCILGYHNAFAPANTLQTYTIIGFDTSQWFGGDVSIASHELAEWMDDPDTSNPAPAWGYTGQVIGCQANLEVGDPLTGTYLPTVTMNGFDYTLQELAFFSWFFRQSPSLGSGGLYSNNGSFPTDAGPVCL